MRQASCPIWFVIASKTHFIIHMTCEQMIFKKQKNTNTSLLKFRIFFTINVYSIDLFQPEQLEFCHDMLFFFSGKKQHIAKIAKKNYKNFGLFQGTYASKLQKNYLKKMYDRSGNSIEESDFSCNLEKSFKILQDFSKILQDLLRYQRKVSYFFFEKKS